MFSDKTIELKKDIIRRKNLLKKLRDLKHNK